LGQIFNASQIETTLGYQ